MWDGSMWWISCPRIENCDIEDSCLFSFHLLQLKCSSSISPKKYTHFLFEKEYRENKIPPVLESNSWSSTNKHLQVKKKKKIILFSFPISKCLFGRKGLGRAMGILCSRLKPQWSHCNFFLLFTEYDCFLKKVN